MTENSEKHLAWLKQEIADLVEIKYTLGAQEHGGDLTDMPVGKLIDEAIQENIDSLVYLLTAKQKLNGYKQFMGSQKAPTGDNGGFVY